MKLNSREAARYFAAPDPGGAGALLHGADPTRVAHRRVGLVTTMVGPAAAEEMRLSRLSAGDLRRDPAALADAVKAVGFFPGPRLVLVEEAGDGLAPLLAATLDDWRPGDARILVTAGSLGAGSALRKTFEKSSRAVAIGIYADPPSRAAIAAELADAGLGTVAPEALADLESLARGLDPGDFAQFVTVLALYKRGDPAPLTAEEVAGLAPQTRDADLDGLLHLVAEGRATAISRELGRLAAQGTGATALTIAAARHFRALYAAATSPEGPEAALARARPPVFGPRRDRMAAQARGFGPERIERALAAILETDLALRSSRPVPAMALVERLLVRVAMLRRPD